MKNWIRIGSLLLAMLLCISLLPTAALAADTATIKYVYMDGDVPTFTQPAGDHDPIACFIYGGSYTVTEDLTGVTLLLNNASVTVGSGGNVNLEDIYLFGSSTLSVGGITLTAAASASALSDNTIEAILAGMGDTDAAYPSISGTLSGELTVAQAKVTSGQALTISSDAKLNVAIKLEVTTGGTLDIGGGGLLNMIGERVIGESVIDGSEFAMNGTLSPVQDAQLCFGPKAVVSGVELHDETAGKTITYDGNNGDHDTFIWLETIGDPAIECKKWVRFIDGGGDPGEFPANRFSVDYDSWNSSAFVKEHGNVVQAYTPTAFTEKTGLEFTLEPPQDRVGDTPIVEIAVGDGTLWRSDFDVEDEHKLSVTNNAFSFTPTTADGFIVRVWWSEFDLSTRMMDTLWCLQIVMETVKLHYFLR